jgi:hypothetical protein
VPGTNLDVGQLSRSKASEASDWTALEESFFAAAPPDVAVAPPPPPSFDDLVASVPERPQRRTARAARAGTEALKTLRWRAAMAGARILAARAGAGARILAARAGAGARVFAARAGAGARSLAEAALRRVPPRARLESDLRALAARLAKELPERPDGRTIAAALAALVVVFGVSASVLGSRSDAREPVPAILPAGAPVVTAALSSAPEPEVAPPAPAVEPAPAARASSRHTGHPALVRPVAKHHRTRHHAAPRAVARPPAFAR